MNKISALQVGDSIPSIQLNPISRLDLIKYAGASGDYNPIHTIDQEAEKAGLPGIIAHGMFTMANMGKLFSPYIAEGFIQEFSTRFTGMVFIDDVNTLIANLVKKEDNQAIFEVKAVNQKEQVVAKGNIQFHLYK